MHPVPAKHLAVTLALSLLGGTASAAPRMPGPPQVLTEGDTVYVAWTDLTELGFEVFLRRSSDGGATFDAPVNVSRTVGTAYEIALAAEGDLVAVAWIDDTPGNRDVYLAVSQDGGATFGAARNLSEDADFSNNPAVGVSAGRVFVSWTLSRLLSWPQPDVLLRVSADGGQSFAPAVNLTDTPETEGISADYSRILTSGDTVYVAWIQGGDLTLRTSRDGGATFDDPVALGPGTGSIAVKGDRVVAAVATFDGTAYAVYLRESLDRAATFSAPVMLTEPTSSYRYADDPRVALSATAVSVAWRERIGTALDVVVRTRPGDGQPFGPARNLRPLLSSSAGVEAYSLAVTDAGPVVAWEDRGGPYGVLALAWSEDGGATFASTLLVDGGWELEAVVDPSFPALAAEGPRIHAAYVARRLEGSTLALRTSLDRGATFGPPGVLNESLPELPVATVHRASYEPLAVSYENPAAPDPAVWSATGTGVTTAPVPGLGWGIADPDHTSSLRYSNAVPSTTDPDAVLVLRARSKTFSKTDFEFRNNHVGWRLTIQDGAHRAELLHTRTPTGNDTVDVYGFDFSPPLHFPWSNSLQHEYEIRRLCCTGQVVVTAVQGDPSWILRSSVRRVSGTSLPWDPGPPSFSWGTGADGAGAAYWQEVEGRVLTLDVPPPPTITSPAEGASLASATPTIQGTARPGAEVVVSVTVGPRPPPGSVPTSAAVTADGTGAWSWTVPSATPLSDDLYVATASQTDRWVQSEESPGTSFRVDTVPPAAPTISSPADGALRNVSSLPVSGLAPDPETHLVEILVDGEVTASALVVAGGFDASVSVADGPRVLTARAVDLAGNASAPCDPVTVTIDTIPPAKPSLTLGVASPTRAELIPVTGVAEPLSQVELREGAAMLATVVADPAGAFSADLALMEGPRVLVAFAVDAAGNAGPDSDPLALEVDRTAPPTPAITSPADGAATNAALVVVSGTAETGARIEVLTGGAVAGTVQADTGGSFSLSLSLAEGGFVVTARAVDAAGNASAESAAVAVTVDRTAPASPSFDAPAPGANVAPGAVRFAGHAEPGALVTVEVAGTTVTATAAADGSWEVSVELTAGPHVATATATDAAGNVSAPAERAVEARAGDAGGCGGCGAGSGGASSVLALLAALSLAPAGRARRRLRHPSASMKSYFPVAWTRR